MLKAKRAPDCHKIHWPLSSPKDGVGPACASEGPAWFFGEVWYDVDCEACRDAMQAAYNRNLEGKEDLSEAGARLLEIWAHTLGGGVSANA
jgi:hypothetical protein